MAYTFNVNTAPATASLGMYSLVSTLVSAGWTKVMDSDGTTYSAAGTQMTHGYPGPGGFGNASAWVRMRAPSTSGGFAAQTREITIQRSTDLLWRIKYSCAATFKGGAPSATVTPSCETADLYFETNNDATSSMRTTQTVGVGQSFTGNGAVLYSARFLLKKTGAPTGNATAKIYAHSGSFGTSSIPTGAALATSATFDVSTLTTTYLNSTFPQLIDFRFTAGNAITLTNATNYIVTVEYSGGSLGNTVDVGTDTSTPTHAGNLSTFDNVTWTATAGTDACFYIYTGAQDEVIMCGNGSDATPGTMFGLVGTAGTYYWHNVCGGAAEGYSFATWNSTIGINTTTISGFCLDVLAANSYPSTDIDPAVMHVIAAANGFASEFVSNSTWPTTVVANGAKARAWLGATTNAGASLTSNNVNVGIMIQQNVGSGISTFGTNQFTGKEEMFPCFWGGLLAAGPKGSKGMSTLFRGGVVLRNMYETADTVGTKDRIFIGRLWLPWNGLPALQ